MQYQPVVRVHQIGRRDALQQLVLDFQRRFARRQTGAIGEPEEMGIDRHGGFTKGDVEHHVGGFAADAGQGLQCLTCAGHHAAMLLNQDLAGLQQMSGFGAKQANGLDVALQAFLPQRQYFLRCVGHREEPVRGLVDADVGGLSRQ